MTASAYLDSLPPTTPVAERAWQARFYGTMPAPLQNLVDRAVSITTASPETVRLGMAMIDHTSLKERAPMTGGETDDEIRAIAGTARRLGARSGCFFPNKAGPAKEGLQGTKLTLVHDFPHGQFDVATAVAAAKAAVALGADDVDTVIDYAALRAGEAEHVRAKLAAVFNEVQAGGAKLKTILKSTVYETYRQLHEAGTLAIAAGTDFLKTCTGKKPLPGYGAGGADVANPLIMVTVLQTIRDSGRTGIGAKIAGGMKESVDFERLRFFSDSIMGPEFFAAHVCVGASGALEVLAKGSDQGPMAY